MQFSLFIGDNISNGLGARFVLNYCQDGISIEDDFFLLKPVSLPFQFSFTEKGVCQFFLPYIFVLSSQSEDGMSR
jgi:hypothetical protein